MNISKINVNGTSYDLAGTTYKLSVNGTTNGDSSNGTNLGTVYAPTTAGTSGLILTSNGSGAPSWTAAPSSAIEYTTIELAISDVNATLAENALVKTLQTLTSSEKTQVLTNLGVSSTQIRNVTVSTSDPTSNDGNDGDIWLVYKT